MSDMSKSFMLMAETMKISMQQMAMIQQQQQHQQQHSMVSAYQPTHHSHLCSAQQAQQRHEQCTSAKYNKYTTKNNVDEKSTTYNKCTATNNELTKRCSKRNNFAFINRLSKITLNLKFLGFFVLSYL